MYKEIIPRIILLIMALIACGMLLAAAGCSAVTGAVTGHRNEIKIGLSQVDITPRPDVIDSID